MTTTSKGPAPESEPPTREEREVKIPLESAQECRARLIEAGAHPIEPRVLEDDQLYDDADGSLRARDAVLRLRRKFLLTDGSAVQEAVLTYKGPGRIDGGTRVREEIEAPSTDGDSLAVILDRLGFRPSFRYQKRRELLELGGALLALDVTPLGDFLEIEGSSAEQIDSVARRLGHDPSEYVNVSYAALWRQRHPSDTPDMLLEEPGGA